MPERSSIEEWIVSVKADWWKSVVPPLTHEFFQMQLDDMAVQVQERMQSERKKDDAVETLLYLRNQGIPFKACIALAKKMGTTRQSLPTVG